MPIRRLNYTGRQRIRHSDADITIRKQGDTHAFTANLRLATYELPESASVHVEAYRQTDWMRFSFGTASNLAAPADCTLAAFDGADGILFRVRVTSNSDRQGVLLAEADQIRPTISSAIEGRRIPLLPVMPYDLGHEVFRIDFTDSPILLINKDVGDWRQIALDPGFFSLVYPGALREILVRILFVEGYRDVDDSRDWRSRWLVFAQRLPGMPQLPNAERQNDELKDWIDSAVVLFSRLLKVRDRFVGHWASEPGT